MFSATSFQVSDDRKGNGSPHSIAERRVPELIPVLGSQPAGDVCHKPGGRLPLLSARPAVTLQHANHSVTEPPFPIILIIVRLHCVCVTVVSGQVRSHCINCASATATSRSESTGTTTLMPTPTLCHAELPGLHSSR